LYGKKQKEGNLKIIFSIKTIIESPFGFEPSALPDATTAVVQLCNENFHPPFLQALVGSGRS
jgi:hypothetical protein